MSELVIGEKLFNFFLTETNEFLFIWRGNADMLMVSTICRKAWDNCRNCLVKRNKSHFKAPTTAVLFGISVFCLWGFFFRGWMWVRICKHMITVHCWCFEHNPPVNIRTLTLIKRMQTKQQLVIKYLFLAFTALKRAVVVPRSRTSTVSLYHHDQYISWK